MLFGSGNALWVTKLIIDSVHVLTEKITGGGGGTPLHLPYRYWSEIESGFGEPDGSHHPMQLGHEFPRIPSREENRKYFLTGPAVGKKIDINNKT